MIIDALSAAYSRKFLQKIIQQVIQLYPFTVQSSMMHHPFFEVIALMKQDNVLDSHKQQKVFQSMTHFFLQMVGHSDFLLSEFPDEGFFRGLKEAFAVQQAYHSVADLIVHKFHAQSGEFDPNYWT